jgi:hypothetical protein
VIAKSFQAAQQKKDTISWCPFFLALHGSFVCHALASFQQIMTAFRQRNSAFHQIYAKLHYKQTVLDCFI